MMFTKNCLIKRRKINIFLLFFAYLLLNGDEYMKQIIPFVKDLSFKTNITEITSIALEHNLQMENGDSIVGSFTISGKYKINDISINEEVFEKNIPFDITLDDKYDASKVKIDIDDFYYEIINDEYLRVHIDVLASNLVYAKEEVLEIREEQRPELVIPEILKEEKEEISEERSESMDLKNDVLEEKVETTVSNEDVVQEEHLSAREDANTNNLDIANKLSSGFLAENEKYITYKVHIIRESETVEEIKGMYNVTTEELEKYNSLENVTIGTKIIIPIKNE